MIEYTHSMNGMIIAGKLLRGLNEFSPSMTNHADTCEIINLISRTKPDKVILVHGIPLMNTQHNLPDEIRECFGGSVEVVHSVNGQEINLMKE